MFDSNTGTNKSKIRKYLWLSSLFTHLCGS
jgi:hypothetical protein